MGEQLNQLFNSFFFSVSYLTYLLGKSKSTHLTLRKFNDKSNSFFSASEIILTRTLLAVLYLRSTNWLIASL